jgi:Ca2+-binding RTX toxin-like protein
MPVAYGDLYAVNEDEILTVTAADGVLRNDADPNGQTLTASLVTGAANGLVALAVDGSFTYQPNLGFVGQDSFTYVASNGIENSVPITVTIDVAQVTEPGDPAPVAFGDLYAVNEDISLTVVAPIGVLHNDVDPNGQTLAASVVTQPANGTLSFAANGSFTYRPNYGFTGTDAFSYTATNGVHTSAPAIVTINVAKAVADNTVTIDANGILRVGGTSGNDNILITRTLLTGKVLVWLNGSLVSDNIAVSSVSRVHAWGREGNDDIVVLGLGADTFIHGGAGNDRIVGDFRSNVIFGGSGVDQLLGGLGDDLLVGGDSADQLYGLLGDDILIGGNLAPALTIDELHAALELWAGSSTRSAALEAAIVDDAALDQLFGSFGDNWLTQ